MGGIEPLAGSIGEGLRRRLPGQRKTQREALALLVATMLDVRSANLAWFRIRNFRGLNTALIEDTLDGAKSTRYKHAARHLLECQSLAPGIKDFGTFETHEAFASRLRARHGRKTGFWAQVSEASGSGGHR
jgi:hypothetical protein